MATTLEDLIQAGLETADCEKSNNFAATEKARIANEALSDVYDFVVATWEEYFAHSADFGLDAAHANRITLAEITSGIAPPPAYPVAVPAPGDRSPIIPNHTFSSTVSLTTAPQYFAVGGTSSFSTSRGFIPPAGRVLQINITTALAGNDTTFTIRKNDDETGATVFVPGGTTGSVNVTEDDFGGPVHFNGIDDVMDLVSVSAGGGETGWEFEGYTIFQLDQPATDFFKALGLTKTTGGCHQPIDPLPSFAARADCDGPRYWIAGQYLTIFPLDCVITDTFTLDYVPNAPVLSIGDVLPVELERWKELITVVMGIKFMTKRRQDTSDLERRQLKLEQGILQAASSRRTAVRPLRVNRRHDQIPGLGWRSPWRR